MRPLTIEVGSPSVWGQLGVLHRKEDRRDTHVASDLVQTLVDASTVTSSTSLPLHPSHPHSSPNPKPVWASVLHWVTGCPEVEIASGVSIGSSLPVQICGSYPSPGG